MRKPSVLIADDHTMVVEAFRKLLEPQYEIVATVADGRSLLEIAPKVRPDVIVIDIGMPLLNGLAAGQRLKQVVPRAKLIYVTMNEDADVASEALRGGASAYLLKSSAASELLKGIHEALRGGSYVTPQIKRAIMDSFVRSPKPRPAIKKLTARQTEVLQLLAEGRLMKEVGAVLGLTTRTVAFHKYRIMEALGVKTNAELIQFAVKNHVVASQISGFPTD
jgi:DNA-binding NarL/FixJ family response regulator